MIAKLSVGIALEAAAMALLLFGGAGTMAWPAGWVFLAEFIAGVVWLSWMLARHDPALLAERMRPPVQRGQPLWDKIVLSGFIVAFAGWLLLMGRCHGSSVPLWLQVVGAAGVALSVWMWDRVMRENTFLAPVVRIQNERGHRVVTTGPYRIVRHPLYAAVLIFFFATPLLLGSVYGLAGSLVLTAGIGIRTALEERELRRNLPGYTDYAARVRYRLVPYLW
jgi:protein-S-isoprenylcysteine O-methyltransferase Ste14